MTDNEIIAAIKNGNEEAYQEMVNKYQQKVLNICNGYLKNHEDALDLTQDIFVRVYFALHKFKGEARFSTWLYRIVVNMSINRLKKLKRERIWQSLDLLFEKENQDATFHPSEDASQLETEERKEVLYNALDKLSEKQKTALVLNRLKDFSYKEVGEIMNVSTSEVGVLINRGMKKLEGTILRIYQKDTI